jgi:PhnB protein
MTEWIPEGWHSVTPRLVSADPTRLVAFLKRAFLATGALRTDSPTQLTIGDSLVTISGVGPRDAMSSFLYLYVPDVDATYERYN